MTFGAENITFGTILNNGVEKPVYYVGKIAFASGNK